MTSNELPYHIRLVNFHTKELELVQELVKFHKLEIGGFSAALRTIIQEWEQYNRYHNSVLSAGERQQIINILKDSAPELTKHDRMLESSGIEVEKPAESSPNEVTDFYSKYYVPKNDYEKALLAYRKRRI